VNEIENKIVFLSMHVQSEASLRGIMVGICARKQCLCHTIYMYFSFLHILVIHVQIETVGGVKERAAGEGVCGYNHQNLMLKRSLKLSLFNFRYTKADSSNCIYKFP